MATQASQAAFAANTHDGALFEPLLETNPTVRVHRSRGRDARGYARTSCPADKGLERVPRILISGCGRPSGCSIVTI